MIFSKREISRRHHRIGNVGIEKNSDYSVWDVFKRPVKLSHSNMKRHRNKEIGIL